MADKPASYKEQKGCQNCGHVFRLYDHSGDNRYFCHVDQSERPLCGSVAMRENWSECYTPQMTDVEYRRSTKEERDQERERSFKSYQKYSRKWDAWSEPREVIERGVCDEWIPQEEAD